MNTPINDENTTTQEKTQAIPFHGSLRDWFAGQAISSVPLRDWSEIKTDNGKIKAWAALSYAIADAMIAARSQSKP